MMKKAMLILIVLVSTLVLGACAFLQHPTFGGKAEGARLHAIEASPHYANGQFRYPVPTPINTDDTNLLVAMVKGRFEPRDRPRPPGSVPTVKTDLRGLPADQDTVVWLGHSSYYVQLAGKRILIDPVFSSYAAPIPGLVRSFDGTSIYTAAEMPAIDYLLITHDHYDHLDYTSMRELQQKTRFVVGGLGTGAHFERWGYPPEKVREGDWYDALRLEPGLAIHILPARHYSGRTLERNKTLWVAFALESAQRRLFFSGDSGFGPHFAEIAQRFDGFDLAALDAGQYNPRWALIHMNPEEAARAAEILRARSVMPAHVGRFSLARHAWDEPFQRMAAASEGKPFRLLTPRIGEAVRVGDTEQRFDRWWEAVH